MPRDQGMGARRRWRRGPLVHVNTIEGLWTGLRNFPRTFRGVSKKYLYQYVAMFEWGYNVKQAAPEFPWAILGVKSATT